jgi:hypothetical protein
MQQAGRQVEKDGGSQATYKQGVTLVRHFGFAVGFSIASKAADYQINS